jgi:Carboxypeptidase regulatory-like domain
MHAQSGIAGTVKDVSGAVMPGVVVAASSDALIEKTRSVITDGSGAYKLVDLRPGTYSVSFTIPGFTPEQRSGIVLTADFVAQVNVDLKVGTSTQAVEVQGAISSLDVQSSTQQDVLTRTIMDDLPTGHSVFADSQTLPGATLSRPDVGGSTGMQQPTLQIHGSNASDTLYQIDGMTINQNYSNGSAVGVYYNDGLVQETSYLTSAIPAEIGLGGIVINMIPKEGGNQFHGSFYGTGGTGGMESNNVSPSDITSGILKAGNRFSNVYDINGSFGGPIIKNKLWFFTTVRRWGVNEYVANTFNTNGQQALDDNRITDALLRLTWQINSKNKLSAFYDKNMKYRGHRRDTTSQYSYIDSDAAVIQHTPLGYLAQAKWTSVLSPKWVVEAGLSMFFLDYTYSYEPSVNASTIETIDLATSVEVNAAAYLYRSIGSRREVSASTSYVTGSHNIKFGFQDSFAPYRETYTMNGDLHAAFYNGVPDVAYLYNTPIDTQEDLKVDLGAYAQDSWTFHRLTVNGGVRWEWLDASILPQSAGAGTWVPARNYPAVANLPNWKTIVPRIGLSYDLFGKGKTVLKASASKYEGGQSVALAQSVDPMFLTSETCTWNAPAGTTEAAMGTNGAAIIAASTFTNCTGFNGSVNTHFASNVKRPYTWEYTFVVQQEILPQFTVSAGYFYRQNRDNIGVANTDVPASDYTPYTINNPLTGGALTVYNEDAAERGQIYLLESNYKQLNSDYNGVDLIAKKIFPGKGAFVQASLTIGRLYGNNLYGLSTPADLNNPNNLYNALGAIGQDSTYQFHVNGAYPLPWHFKLSGNYQYLTGQPFTPSYTVNTAIDPGLTQLTQAINLVKPGSERLPNLSLLDFRVSRTFTVHERWKIEPMADLYNVLNVNTPYTEVTTVGANLGHYSANTEGRFLKVGLQVNF